MTFEIRKNVPKPKTRHADRFAKYPFGEMEIGDSFLISETSTEKDKNRAGAAIFNTKKKWPERKFCQRVDASGGIGIWRDADRVEPQAQ